MFVAGFNNEDPGVTSIAQRCMLISYVIYSLSDAHIVFGLPPTVVGAALGGLGVVEVSELLEERRGEIWREEH